MNPINQYSIYRGEGAQLTNSLNWFKDEKVIEEFLKYLESVAGILPDNLSMLEIGSGTGILGHAVKNRLQTVYKKIVNLTLSDRNIKDIPQVDGVHIVESENKKLPFGDKTFDLIISRSVTHYEKNNGDEISVLGEIKRVLKDNGVYVTQHVYLVNNKEVELHHKINSLVHKITNANTYKHSLDIHKKVFSTVNVLEDKFSLPLVIDRNSFIKRYELDSSVGDIVFDYIREMNPEEIPNFWFNGDDFGWKVDYMVLMCGK